MHYKPSDLTCIFAVVIACVSASEALAIAPQHQVAQSYGGTRLYAHDSVIISPYAVVSPLGISNLYSQTTTAAASVSPNTTKRDSLCRSVVNTSDNDYFIPWRSANATGTGQVNEWTSFIHTVEAGAVPGVTVGSCCYPRINPNKPCNVSYTLGKRTAGAFPSNSPSTHDQSAEVPNYGAEGDISLETVGYNRKQTWVCDSGEWVYTRDEGGCYQNGVCNTYDATTNPTGYNGATVNAIPSSNRDILLCNGVVPTTVNGNSFPQPDTIANSGVFGTGGWSWKCPGQTGGTSETCHANYAGGPLAGVCGYASGRTYTTAPTSTVLCYVGSPTAVNANTLTNKWAWTCNGVNGGNSTTCSANIPTVANASCGSYASGGHSAGLISSETVNGLPNPSYLCSKGTLLGNIMGNGTIAAPWTWTCFNSANNTTASCKNTYTKSGICGLTNGMSIPTGPTNVNSANMCAQGRWYNRATTGATANTVTWNATANTWTWACLGHNLTTGGISNDLCTATLCNECAGTGTETVTAPISGTYANCQFDTSQASITYQRTYTRQTSSTDATLFVFMGNDRATLSSNTDVATGYCPPCYKRTTAVPTGTVTLNACTNSPPLSIPAQFIVQ